MKTHSMALTGALSLGAMLAFVACASDPEPLRPTGLQASPSLTADKAIPGAWLYRNPKANFSKYRRLMVENVNLYSGPEANFQDIELADRLQYAQTIGATFREVLAKKYQFAGAPAPDTLRIRLTLIGVESTTGGVATATRILPIGLAINAINAANSEGGTMTGGIDLAVEIFDSQSNELLAGAVRRIEPAVFDFSSTLSTSDTVKSCAEDAAAQLRAALDRNLAG